MLYILYTPSENGVKSRFYAIFVCAGLLSVMRESAVNVRKSAVNVRKSAVVQNIDEGQRA